MRLNAFLSFLLVCLIVSIPVFGTGCASTGDPQLDIELALDRAEGLVVSAQLGIEILESFVGPLSEEDQATLDDLRAQLDRALERVRVLRKRLGLEPLPEDPGAAVKELQDAHV